MRPRIGAPLVVGVRADVLLTLECMNVGGGMLAASGWNRPRVRRGPRQRPRSRRLPTGTPPAARPTAGRSRPGKAEPHVAHQPTQLGDSGRSEPGSRIVSRSRASLGQLPAQRPLAAALIPAM
jgi:hypothetical protein